MYESVVDAGLALLDQRFVAGRVSKAENPVGVVGGLLVPPPARAVFAHARYRPRPETRVVRIAQCLRMPGEAVGLHPAGAQEPSGGARFRKHAVFELGERRHGAVCGRGSYRNKSKYKFRCLHSLFSSSLFSLELLGSNVLYQKKNRAIKQTRFRPVTTDAALTANC